MPRLRLGQIAYINCLPVYHVLEEGLLPFEAELVKKTPTDLNRLFMNDRLDVSPLSSIEYARNQDKCLILPDLSISADGRVMSVLLFSKAPVTELDGGKVCLTVSSATSVALLKVLFDHYYHVEVEFETAALKPKNMLDKADGALLIGDNAMQAYHYVLEKQLPYHVTDLGEAWKQFTGLQMVYAVWAVRQACADVNGEDVANLGNMLVNAKEIGLSQLPAVIAKAQQRSGLPLNVLEEYFHTIKYDFDESHRKALLTFYDFAYKSGIIEERVNKLRVL